MPWVATKNVWSFLGRISGVKRHTWNIWFSGVQAYNKKKKRIVVVLLFFFCGKQPFLPQRHLLSHKSSTVSKSHFTEVVSASASYSPIPVIDCTPLQSSFFSYSTSIYIFPVSAHNSDYLHFSPDHHSVSWVCFCLSFLPAANHLSHLIFSGLGAVYFPALCSSSY